MATLTDSHNRNALEAEDVGDIRRHTGNAIEQNLSIDAALLRGEFATPATVPQREELIRDIRERMSTGDYYGAAQAIEDYRGPWLNNTMSRDAMIERLNAAGASWGIVSSTLANDGASMDLITDYHRDALATNNRGEMINVLANATGTTDRDAAIAAAAREACANMAAHGGVMTLDEITYDDVQSGVHASVPDGKALGGRG